ncbi:YqjF family protein [Autumnicola musiva]|uniref:DUF2071 domain-containing protein n=1 Tax=Autumnicola musiva TaxID=3075589 RepID=A0ABU3D3R1_9FLAO|nr:DUF2071 domain-containing protein [Zunongwangia sp. F117]MDT0676041.1 DUF2071 domain-containing protein [Zunongwangia sp. F117]
MGILTCEWKKLAFANYIVSPKILESYLPKYTEIDFFHGKCFVSLVGFQFKNVAVGGIKIPFHTSFEEVNLRFYVKHFNGKEWRQGVVFISEIVDKISLTILANNLLHESYQNMPMRHTEEKFAEFNKYGYFWRKENEWQHFKVSADKNPLNVDKNSETEFLIQRLWGYGKHSEKVTNEYHVVHPLWQVYKVKNYSIKADFKLFGNDFSHLNNAKPHSIILAEGSKTTAEYRGKLK